MIVYGRLMLPQKPLAPKHIFTEHLGDCRQKKHLNCRHDLTLKLAFVNLDTPLPSVFVFGASFSLRQNEKQPIVRMKC